VTLKRRFICIYAHINIYIFISGVDERERSELVADHLEIPLKMRGVV
jgi:hypothetical protein